jgi:hypothetical protein
MIQYYSTFVPLLATCMRTRVLQAAALFGRAICKVKCNLLFRQHSFNARDTRVSFQISFYLTCVALSLVVRRELVLRNIRVNTSRAALFEKYFC